MGQTPGERLAILETEMHAITEWKAKADTRMQTHDTKLNSLAVQRGWVLGFIAGVGFLTGSGWLSLKNFVDFLTK